MTNFIHHNIEDGDYGIGFTKIYSHNWQLFSDFKVNECSQVWQILADSPQRNIRSG